MSDSRTAYVNGTYMPLSEARISPMDRGFLFGDSVYEVIPAYDGRFFRLEEHLQRLRRSLERIDLDPRISGSELRSIVENVKDRNGGGDIAVYIQVSRGAPTVRDLRFSQGQPTVFATSISPKGVSKEVREQGVSAATAADIRWGGCDIKSTALLANVMAMQEVGGDAVEAILIRDGHLTEGGSSNVFVVLDGRVMTAPRDNRILAGITRDVVLEILTELNIDARQEEVPEDTLRAADEIWITSSTREVWPVTALNGKPVGSGRPGPIWRLVDERYETIKRAQ